MSHEFFTETDETVMCEDCKRQFKAYNYYEDCPLCNDGEIEETGETCHACGGRGDLEWVEKEKCQDCMYLFLTRDDD